MVYIQELLNNNRVFLSRIYLLIVTPQKFNVLKINMSPRGKVVRDNILVLRTSNFQGATIRLIDNKKKQTTNTLNTVNLVSFLGL